MNVQEMSPIKKS